MSVVYVCVYCLAAISWHHQPEVTGPHIYVFICNSSRRSSNKAALQQHWRRSTRFLLRVTGKPLDRKMHTQRQQCKQCEPPPPSTGATSKLCKGLWLPAIACSRCFTPGDAWKICQHQCTAVWCIQLLWIWTKPTLNHFLFVICEFPQSIEVVDQVRVLLPWHGSALPSFSYLDCETLTEKARWQKPSTPSTPDLPKLSSKLRSRKWLRWSWWCGAQVLDM